MSDFDYHIYQKALLELQMSGGSPIPDPDKEQIVLERLKKKFPNLEIDPNEECLILSLAQSLQGIGKPQKTKIL